MCQIPLVPNQPDSPTLSLTCLFYIPSSNTGGICSTPLFTPQPPAILLRNPAGSSSDSESDDSTHLPQPNQSNHSPYFTLFHPEARFYHFKLELNSAAAPLLKIIQCFPVSESKSFLTWAHEDLHGLDSQLPPQAFPATLLLHPCSHPFFLSCACFACELAVPTSLTVFPLGVPFESFLQLPHQRSPP